uniref:Uncharacterized protein n=1 Tax=Anabas testudineus TaxID=64144 RepID=A0A3Q1KCW5_ANATE
NIIVHAVNIQPDALTYLLSKIQVVSCFFGGTKICSSPIETCTRLADACGSIIITAGSMPSFSRGCVSSRDCMRMNYPGISSCHSCGFDLCN